MIDAKLSQQRFRNESELVYKIQRDPTIDLILIALDTIIYVVCDS